MAVGRVLSVMITGTGRKSWVQISSCIIWMFRIPNYIAVWKNEIETSLKARLKFPKRKWIDTSLFSNRRPETSLYKELHLIGKRSRYVLVWQVQPAPVLPIREAAATPAVELFYLP